MRTYLDNVIASAWIRDDLALPQERRALKLIREHRNVQQLELVTSLESWREQDRTTNAGARGELRAAREKMPVVSQDPKVLGFNSIDLRYRGFISSPLGTDIIDLVRIWDLESCRMSQTIEIDAYIRSIVCAPPSDFVVGTSMGLMMVRLH